MQDPSRAPSTPQRSSASRPLVVAAIPSADSAFRRHVESIARQATFSSPEALETRLRALYPRIAVRARALAGEPATWYVYRDGRWQPNPEGAWWTDPRVGRLDLSLDGWLLSANATAMGLLGLDAGSSIDRYFTDFVAPGTLEDASTLFRIISAGHPLDATVRVRPTTGDVIAVDLHAVLDGDRIVFALRLADDIDPEPSAERVVPTLTCLPADDTIFAEVAERALAGMPEPIPAELAIRLRRLYPHAQVAEGATGWTVYRDASPASPDGWWADPSLPEVRFTDRGLIVEANPAAEALLGMPLVGRHWHELVTPGTTAQVDQVIELIVARGGAVSRFRMPAADGSFVEFDSWTDVVDGALRTVMRPLGRGSG